MDNEMNDLIKNQAEKLVVLREMVKLNPMQYFKVQRARKQAEKFRDLYVNQNPSDVIEVDYTIADDLEYSLRFSALQKSLEKSFKQFSSLENDGYGLEEFTEDFLNQHLNSYTVKR